MTPADLLTATQAAGLSLALDAPGAVIHAIEELPGEPFIVEGEVRRWYPQALKVEVETDAQP